MMARRMEMVTNGSSWIVSTARRCIIQNINALVTQNGQCKAVVELRGKKLVYKEEAAPWSLPKRRESRPEPPSVELTDRSTAILYAIA